VGLSNLDKRLSIFIYVYIYVFCRVFYRGFFINGFDIFVF